MNDMRSTSKQTESQDLFKELVGDEVIFFNKDVGTENVFNLSLIHISDPTRPY